MLDDETAQESGFGISLSRDIILAHSGRLRLLQQSGKQILRIELPAHYP
jgi:nitrogen-specific signal transduction histidine kinase